MRKCQRSEKNYPKDSIQYKEVKIRSTQKARGCPERQWCGRTLICFWTRAPQWAVIGWERRGGVSSVYGSVSANSSPITGHSTSSLSQAQLSLLLLQSFLISYTFYPFFFMSFKLLGCSVHVRKLQNFLFYRQQQADCCLSQR